MPVTRVSLTGWVKMPRYIMDLPVFENEREFKVYAWCRMRANPIPKVVNGIRLRKGQFITSKEKAAIELNMSPAAVHRWLKRLESELLIKLSPNHHFTVVTVINYDVSASSNQNSEPQSEPQSERLANRKVNTEEEVLLRNKKVIEKEGESAHAPVPSEPIMPDPAEGWGFE